MNDWHHFATDTDESNLWSADWFAEHPEYLIGEEGARGWPEKLWNVLRYFQDFAHEPVRAIRRDLALESAERYELDGMLFDFMRCPGYFKRGKEEAGTPLMTDLMRETRAGLDAAGEGRDRLIRFAARVPTTIGGSERLGLDVRTWVREGIVDTVVPSCFFGQDTEEDVGEWMDLVSGTGVQVYPAIEEGYVAGHTSDFHRWYFNPPVMTPLTVPMTCAIAARHHLRGVDGLYAFNFFGSAATYNYDNRAALDDMADPLRLQFSDKTYLVMRSSAAFPNCLETERQLPITLSEEANEVSLEVADDLPAAVDRLSECRLRLHIDNQTTYDQLRWQ